MNVFFSWDDGAEEDVKLMELHCKYNIPGMFFVPTKNREGRKVIDKNIIKKFDSNIIFFGGHTQNHTYLTKIPINYVKSEVEDNKKYLEDIVGHEIKHFCLPGGAYNADILSIIKPMFSTIRTADTMNFNNGYLIKPSFHFYPRGIRSLLINGICHESYGQVMFIVRNMKTSYFDLIESIVSNEFKNQTSSDIHIWGHSWEIEKLDLWKRLERLFELVCTYNIARQYE